MSEIFDKANKTLEEINVENPVDESSLEQFRIKYLGSKNILKDLFGEISKVAPEQKKDFGQLVNLLKKTAEEKFENIKVGFETKQSKSKIDFDLTAPGYQRDFGARHPISIVKNEIVSIFSRIGFTVAEGPEIEDDWHNFSALGTPEDHPARDMQDTFYITEDKNVLLRTHTSSVQIRMMETHLPPLRILMPGRVYRNETISARAHCTFHQIEGLYIDENVSFADLKQAMFYFVRELFGQHTEIRFRPSFFPFTEPSAEIDVSCMLCGGDGCSVCKHSGWVEIGGCGMVDPQVLENCKLDPQKYSGYAFGMGIERITMLKYQINDLRLFFENDMRFLQQFKKA
jgi:phenylalanyl-tRNA synthetase alpha chain